LLPEDRRRKRAHATIVKKRARDAVRPKARDDRAEADGDRGSRRAAYER